VVTIIILRHFTRPGLFFKENSSPNLTMLRNYMISSIIMTSISIKTVNLIMKFSRSVKVGYLISTLSMKTKEI